MTPKEKAEELVNKFNYGNKHFLMPDAKQCALISVDEIINCLDDDDLYIQGESNIDDFVNYYEEVKQEIEKL